MTGYTKDIDGEPMISTAGMALLFGVSEELCRAELQRQSDNGCEGFIPPGEWIRNGKRRAAEYRAETGRNDAEGALSYWAAREGRVS
ncbi:hypothetical protein [Rhodococcoides fascians]|uniref:hypothetical protein n=1 Tax=Rhodococcoides fascians TaxID=1828 RepID=UPI000564398D|nr:MULTISPECIES: hypothetical protein [Rhodococcus]OZF00551.1 hypothetical protein CH301_12785 [Rhodococcus sp. 15-1189-1-1a]OZF14430.1 hypothetical protein CH299_13465 [Rhodococcus sp. 14-2686-1-2]